MNYKLLLYKVIVGAITVALSMAFLYAPLHMLLTSRPFEDLMTLLGDFLQAIVSGDTGFLNTFAEEFRLACSVLLEYLQDNTSNIVLFFVALLLIVVVSRFLDGIGNYTFGCLIGNKMSSYAKTPFVVNYVGNLASSALWQVVYVPVTFVYDLLILGLCYAFFLVLLNIISISFLASIVALMFSVTLLLASQAIKLTVFNDVIPALVTEKARLREALSKSLHFTKERFGTLFSTYLVTAVLILCTNVVFAVASFGAALLITIPMSYLMLICIQFVSYYTYGQKKYFLAENNIVLPKEKTQENFYDDFEV